MRRRVLAPVVLLGLSLLLGTAVATPANAAQTAPTVKIASITLVAKGAAVDVALAIRCDAGLSADVSIEIDQSVRKTAIARSSDFVGFYCTGQDPQTLTVRLIAFGNGAPFQLGVALASAALSVCEPEVSCESARTSQVIRIQKK
jgi:hypothetical protein